MVKNMEDRLIPLDKMPEFVGHERTKILEMVEEIPEFPKPVKVRSSKKTLFFMSDVQNWITLLKQQHRDNQTTLASSRAVRR
jgi:predicted DNA-binding transcriptional regulator AlpA